MISEHLIMNHSMLHIIASSYIHFLYRIFQFFMLLLFWPFRRSALFRCQICNVLVSTFYGNIMNTGNPNTKINNYDWKLFSVFGMPLNRHRRTQQQQQQFTIYAKMMIYSHLVSHSYNLDSKTENQKKKTRRKQKKLLLNDRNRTDRTFKRK